SPSRSGIHFLTRPCDPVRASGIRPGFPGLSRSSGQVAHVLRTRSPLSTGPKSRFSLDLHVLGAPPAFVLSQDQTLHRDLGRHHLAEVWPSIESRSADRTVVVGAACAHRRVTGEHGIDMSLHFQWKWRLHWLLAFTALFSRS